MPQEQAYTIQKSEDWDKELLSFLEIDRSCL